MNEFLFFFIIFGDRSSHFLMKDRYWELQKAVGVTSKGNFNVIDDSLNSEFSVSWIFIISVLSAENLRWQRRLMSM